MNEAELLKEIEHQRNRAHNSDSQLCWLANWCKEKFGVENNNVIGKSGWPKVLVEVVAKVVDERIKKFKDLRDTVSINCKPPADCNDPKVLKTYMKACFDEAEKLYD